MFAVFVWSAKEFESSHTLYGQKCVANNECVHVLYTFNHQSIARVAFNPSFQDTLSNIIINLLYLRALKIRFSYAHFFLSIQDNLVLENERNILKAFSSMLKCAFFLNNFNEKFNSLFLVYSSILRRSNQAHFKSNIKAELVTIGGFLSKRPE